jgi:hypothetical protein
VVLELTLRMHETDACTTYSVCARTGNSGHNNDRADSTVVAIMGNMQVSA